MRRMRRKSPRSRRSEVMTFETKNIGGETPEQLSASPRLFESALLDKLSRVHHLTPVIIYTPIILGLTIYSLTLQGAATVALGLFVGYTAWTLTEYFGHRYLFHTVFALPLGLGPRFQFLIHGVHHIYPSDPLRLVMPPLLSAPIMLLALSVIRLLFGGVFGWPVLAGFIAGYVIYDCVHFLDASRPAEVKARPSRAPPAYAAPLPRRDQGFWRARDLVGLRVRHGLSQGRHAGREGGLRSRLAGPGEPFVLGNHFDPKFTRLREL